MNIKNIILAVFVLGFATQSTVVKTVDEDISLALHNTKIYFTDKKYHAAMELIDKLLDVLPEQLISTKKDLSVIKENLKEVFSIEDFDENDANVLNFFFILQIAALKKIVFDLSRSEYSSLIESYDFDDLFQISHKSSIVYSKKPST